MSFFGDKSSIFLVLIYSEPGCWCLQIFGRLFAELSLRKKQSKKKLRRCSLGNSSAALHLSASLPSCIIFLVMPRLHCWHARTRAHTGAHLRSSKNVFSPGNTLSVEKTVASSCFTSNNGSLCLLAFMIAPSSSVLVLSTNCRRSTVDHRPAGRNHTCLFAALSLLKWLKTTA